MVHNEVIMLKKIDVITYFRKDVAFKKLLATLYIDAAYGYSKYSILYCGFLQSEHSSMLQYHKRQLTFKDVTKSSMFSREAQKNISIA